MMISYCKEQRLLLIKWAAVVTAVLLFITITVTRSLAAPLGQEGDGVPAAEESYATDCQECHVNIANHWSHSPHAHAFDDPVFQQRWMGMGKLDDCLSCHTTSFEPATGEYAAEGVDCRACHGEIEGKHPPAPVAILADAEYCGKCHTTTLGEWHRTGHATSGVGCMQCHDPHNQGPLFANADEMCLNCHVDSMGEYLEDLHVSRGIGCVDCHALVIPPDPIPDDGIVPTGHSFDITPATCVACHTDALHAGFSLPGFENGASEAIQGWPVDAVETIGFVPPQTTASANGAAGTLSTEQRIQTLEAALASRDVSAQFQGGLVGLVFGGMTAWFVASNLRERNRNEEHEEEG